MLKVFLAMLAIALMPLLTSAQKLNFRGEKMVSKIETQDCSFRTGKLRKGDTYTFTYDDNNRIIGMVREGGDIVQRITKKNGTLEREYFYDKKIRENSIKYEYLLDESGNILQKNYYEGIGDPLVAKKVWNFIYRYDDFSGRCVVDSVIFASLYRDIRDGMRDYDFCDGETEPYTLKVNRKEGGLFYTIYYGSRYQSDGVNDMDYAIGLGDDTNLNLNFLWGGTPYTIGGETNDALEFLIPEWINCKSGYIYAADSKYEYVPFKDKQGNIVRIEQVNKINGKLRQVFIITYL